MWQQLKVRTSFLPFDPDECFGLACQKREQRDEDKKCEFDIKSTGSATASETCVSVPVCVVEHTAGL